MASRAVNFNEVKADRIMIVPPRTQSFVKDDTKETISFQDLSEKYNYGDAAPIIEEFIYNGAVSISETGIHKPKKKKKPEDGKESKRGAGPAAMPGFNPAMMQQMQHMQQMQQMQQALQNPQLAQQNPQLYAQLTMQMQQHQMALVPASPAKKEDDAKGSDKDSSGGGEEKYDPEKQQWNYYPEDPKHQAEFLEMMKARYAVGVRAVMAYPQISKKTAPKAAEYEAIVKVKGENSPEAKAALMALESSAKDLLGVPWFIPSANNVPIQGAKASYKAKHTKNSIYTWPYPPTQTENLPYVDPNDLKNKWVKFIPKVWAKYIYCNGDNAYFQHIMVGAVILEVKEANIKYIPADINTLLQQTDPKAMEVAQNSIARLKALKEKKEAAKKGTTVPESPKPEVKTIEAPKEEIKIGDPPGAEQHPFPMTPTKMVSPASADTPQLHTMPGLAGATWAQSPSAPVSAAQSYMPPAGSVDFSKLLQQGASGAGAPGGDFMKFMAQQQQQKN